MMFSVSLAAPLSLSLSVLSLCHFTPTSSLPSQDFFLFSQFAGKLRKMKVGWRRDSVASVGESLTQKLTRALWYIDPHHDKFVARGIQLPPHLGTLEGYNDYKQKRECPSCLLYS